MYCKKCAADQFTVVNVYRDRVRRTGRWVFSENDTRLVMCRVCGQRYFTETSIVPEVNYSTERMKRVEKPLDGDVIYLFDEGKD